MEYTVTVRNAGKILLTQTADMPTCMHLLGTVMQNEWTDAEIISEQTGEIILRWAYNDEYGVERD